jgi:hypothetical protein
VAEKRDDEMFKGAECGSRLLLVATSGILEGFHVQSRIESRSSLELRVKRACLLR